MIGWSFVFAAFCVLPVGDHFTNKASGIPFLKTYYGNERKVEFSIFPESHYTCASQILMVLPFVA